MRTIWFIDTSVLCELVRVPGKDQQHKAIAAEFKKRIHDGDRFIIPITAVVETGNHICNAKVGDRRGAAGRFSGFLKSVVDGTVPWVVNDVEWGPQFLDRFLAGGSTGQSFIDLAGNGLMGGGDVAILVERDDLSARSPGLVVKVWTLEAVMGAYA